MPRTNDRQVRPHRPARLPSGLTLVELLVVMGLLILLASISLGTLRGLLRSQKVAQASTLVKQYLQNAQIRAVTNGRPVAVFFDRVALDAAPGNFTVTRLQFGEVFPPYVGDELDAVGQLLQSPSGHGSVLRFAAPAPVGTPQPVNSAVKVASGIGAIIGNQLTRGFIEDGDLIEVEGSPAIFVINGIASTPGNEIDLLISNDVPGGNGRFAVTFNRANSPNQLPISGNQFRRFKIYRQPTKSLVGGVSLPRGTCIDLSLSGIGPFDNSVLNGSFIPPPAVAGPANFSRVGLVFDGQGRVSYLLQETSTAGQLNRSLPIPVASNLYLMVGRTDQVLPGFPSDPAPVAALRPSGTELPQSNLVDLENVWISCNPFTGEIKSSPAAAVDPATFTIADADERLRSTVRQARQLAIAGVSN